MLGTVDLLVQGLLAELLVVVAAQADADGVELLLLDALEVVLAEARRQQLLAHHVVPGIEVVAMHLAAEYEHFLVHLRAEAGSQRVQGLLDLGDAATLAATVGEHRGGQPGQALLAGRIEGRAAVEDQADVDQRRIAVLLQQVDVRLRRVGDGSDAGIQRAEVVGAGQ